MAEKPYRVGYKKPPCEHQFKKGSGGNPKGRPRGAVSLKSDVREELATLMSITEGGKRRKITRQQAIVKVAIANALKGEPKALQVALDLAGRFSPDDPTEEAIAASDKALLEAYLERSR